MLAQERYDYILEKLKENGSVTAIDISESLSVSAETIRRDLILLEAHGKLKRVFGGAVSTDKQAHFESLETRLDSNIHLKAEIAEYAISFIDNNDTIAMESGSTATEMAKALLKTALNITVITNSITVFNILKARFKVILIGGEYIKEDDCFAGFLAEEFLRKFHVNKAFIFPAVLSADNGIECFFMEAINIARILTEISDKVFVAADSEKFNSRATYKALELSPEFIYITDSKVKDDVKKEFDDKGLLLYTGGNDDADTE